MNDLHCRLNFKSRQDERNLLPCSKEHIEISKIATFGGKNVVNVAKVKNSQTS